MKDRSRKSGDTRVRWHRPLFPQPLNERPLPKERRQRINCRIGHPQLLPLNERPLPKERRPTALLRRRRSCRPLNERPLPKERRPSSSALCASRILPSMKDRSRKSGDRGLRITAKLDMALNERPLPKERRRDRGRLGLANLVPLNERPLPKERRPY